MTDEPRRHHQRWRDHCSGLAQPTKHGRAVCEADQHEVSLEEHRVADERTEGFLQFASVTYGVQEAAVIFASSRTGSVNTIPPIQQNIHEKWLRENNGYEEELWECVKNLNPIKIDQGNLIYWWDNQLFSVKSRQKFLWRMTSHHTRIFHCNDMNCFHKKIKWVNSVWMQDAYMLLRLDSISWLKTLKNSSLRELVVNYTLPRNDESSQPKGWIQGNTRIGPVLEITTSYLYGKHGIEIRIWSLSNDNSQSWVRISHGSNKFVIDSNYNNTEVPADLPEEQASQLKMKDFPARSKAKAKPQRREPVDLPSIIPMNESKWIDIEPGESSLSAYEISKKVIHLLRHSQTVQREEDGAVQFWRMKNYLQNQFPQVPYWSDDRWKICLAAGGGAKRRYQYCTDISGTIVSLRALQGHSGRNLINLSLKDNVVIQRGFFQHIYHIGCAF